MPLDPSILLQGQGPKFGTLGDIISTGSALTQARQSRQMNDLALREKKRVLDEDSALRAAIQKHGGNYDEAAKTLDIGGFADAALGLRQKVSEMRKKQADAVGVELANWGARLNTIGQITNGIKDQDSFNRARQVLQKFDPDLAGGMGDVYDPAVVDEIRNRGLSTKDFLGQKNDAVKATNDALRIELEAARNKQTAGEAAPKIAEGWTNAAAKWFGSAHDQSDWDNSVAFLTAQGAPKEIISAFGPKFTPEAVKGARDRSLTEDQRRSLAISQQNANTATAKLKQDAKFEGAFVPSAPQAPGQKNDAYLQQLPAALQSQVKALSDGRMAFPTGNALRSEYWQNMLKAVASYDPSFDAINYNARAMTRKDFTSGKSAQQVNALNTVIGHLDSLDSAAKDLKNTSSTWWNSLANWAADASGKPAPKTFEATREAVADELTRVWRQSGGSESDIQERKKQLATSSSPEQFRAVISQIGDLLESKLSSMQSQYDQGMGTSDVKMLTPEAEATLGKLRGKDTAPPPQVLAAGPGQHDFANGQTWIVSPDGKSARRIK